LVRATRTQMREMRCRLLVTSGRVIPEKVLPTSTPINHSYRVTSTTSHTRHSTAPYKRARIVELQTTSHELLCRKNVGRLDQQPWGGDRRVGSFEPFLPPPAFSLEHQLNRCTQNRKTHRHLPSKDAEDSRSPEHKDPSSSAQADIKDSANGCNTASAQSQSANPESRRATKNVTQRQSTDQSQGVNRESRERTNQATHKHTQDIEQQQTARKQKAETRHATPNGRRNTNARTPTERTPNRAQTNGTKNQTVEKDEHRSTRTQTHEIPNRPPDTMKSQF
jgi:hypothetical protein